MNTLSQTTEPRKREVDAEAALEAAMERTRIAVADFRRKRIEAERKIIIPKGSYSEPIQTINDAEDEE